MNNELALKQTPEYIRKIKAYAVAKAQAKAAEALKITLSKSEIDDHEKIRAEAEAARLEIRRLSYVERDIAVSAKVDAETAIKDIGKADNIKESINTANTKILIAIEAYQKCIHLRQEALKIIKRDIAERVAEQEEMMMSAANIESYIYKLTSEVTLLTNEGLKISKV